MAQKEPVLGYIPVAGRKFQNVKTGKIITRRQFDKLRGINFEQKAKDNKAKDLGAALARPARGRKKAESQEEIELRLEGAKVQAQVEAEKKLAAKVKKASKYKPPLKIRKQLVTTHKARRIAFYAASDLPGLVKQMRDEKAPNGKRLVFSYGIGLVAFDEHDGSLKPATLTSQNSPRSTKMIEGYPVTPAGLEQITNDFLQEHSYLIFVHWYLHLKFDIDYVTEKKKAKNKKNLPRKAK